jgi:hypothetical protein
MKHSSEVERAMYPSALLAGLVRSTALFIMIASSRAAAQTPPLACGLRGAHLWQSTRPSPLDSATLSVDGRIAVICYSRPSARGRSVDSLVQSGIAWRTGANEPTTLTLTGRLNVGGALLDPGRYVILTVPEAGEWHIVFNTTPDTEPAKMFASLHQVAMGTGSVERTAVPVEQFTIRALADAAAFTLEWGNWRVHVPVRASP